VRNGNKEASLLLPIQTPMTYIFYFFGCIFINKVVLVNTFQLISAMQKVIGWELKGREKKTDK
jgi:hypothetical protein